MVGNSICGKLLSDIFPYYWTNHVTQKQGRQVIKYNKLMLCLHPSLKKNNFKLFTHSIWYLIFPSGWRGRIILSIIPRILIIVLKGKSKHVSIQELWLSSIYKNVIKAGIFKKTSMCSLLKFPSLNQKTMYYTICNRSKELFFLKEKKKRLSSFMHF